MANFSNYLANAICAWTKGTTMPSAPASVYVSLFNGDPTDAGSGGTEVTTTIRVGGRVACTFGAVTNGSMSNSADVDFGAAAGGATVTHFGIHDAASAGNLLYSAPATGGGSVGAGQSVKFAAGALTIAMD